MTDPTYDEETLSDYSITFLLNIKTSNEFHKIKYPLFVAESIIHKLNGKAITYDKIMELKQECYKNFNNFQKKFTEFFETTSQKKILEIII